MLNSRDRFGIIAGGLSAAIMIANIALLAFVLSKMQISDTILLGLIGPVLFASVILWHGLGNIIEGILSTSKGMKKLILGEFDVDGVWLQAESGPENRIAIISATSGERGLEWMGYALNADLVVVSHVAFALTNNEWPNMVFNFNDSLADEGHNWRQGAGEIQFERGFKKVMRFTGIMRGGDGVEKRLLNGHRITKRRELKQLHTLEGRAAVISRYWEVFFPNAPRLRELKKVSSETTDTLPQLGRSIHSALPAEAESGMPSVNQHPINTPSEPVQNQPKIDDKLSVADIERVIEAFDRVRAAEQPASKIAPSSSAGTLESDVSAEEIFVAPVEEDDDVEESMHQAEGDVIADDIEDDIDAPHENEADAGLPPVSTRRNVKNVQISEIENQLKRARAAAEEIAETTLKREVVNAGSGADANTSVNADGRLQAMRSKLKRRKYQA